MAKINFSIKKLHLPVPKTKIKKDAFSKTQVRKLNWTTILAILSYLNVLVLIPYINSKSRPFVRFHAKQGIILTAYFALFVFSFYVPVLFWILGVYYVFCVLWGIVMVILGRERGLPLLGRVAAIF